MLLDKNAPPLAAGSVRESVIFFFFFFTGFLVFCVALSLEKKSINLNHSITEEGSPLTIDIGPEISTSKTGPQHLEPEPE